MITKCTASFLTVHKHLKEKSPFSVLRISFDMLLQQSSVFFILVIFFEMSQCLQCRLFLFLFLNTHFLKSLLQMILIKSFAWIAFLDLHVLSHKFVVGFSSFHFSSTFAVFSALRKDRSAQLAKKIYMSPVIASLIILLLLALTLIRGLDNLLWRMFLF